MTHALDKNVQTLARELRATRTDHASRITDIEAQSDASLGDLLAGERDYSMGTTIETRAEGFGFKAVARDPDLVTAGGTYLRAQWRQTGFDVRQFGVKTDGTTDATQAIQRALDRAVGEGVNVLLPPGSIRLDGRVTLDLSGYTDEEDEKGVSIKGAGRGVTELLQGEAGAGITVLGGAENAARHHHAALTDFKVSGFDQAILLKNAAFMDIQNVFAYEGDLAFQLEDVLSCRFSNVYARAGKRGLFARARQEFSNPNSLTFFGCHFGRLKAYGARFTNPAGVAFFGGSFEACGYDITEPTRGGILVSGAGVAGGVGVSCSSVYFEAQGGPADIQIAQGVYPCTYDFYGNIFNRIGTAAAQATRNILLTTLEGSGRAVLNTRNAYRDGGGFVPTANEPYIQIIDAGNCAVWHDGGDTFNTTAAWPAQSGGSVRAACAFNGTAAAPAPDGDKNIAAINKTGTGEYQLVFKQPIPTENRSVFIGLGDAGVGYVVAESITGVTFRTADMTGARKDFSRVNVNVVR